MKRPILLTLTVLLITTACFEDDDPVAPDGAEPGTLAWHLDRIRQDRLMADLEMLTSIPTRYMHYEPGTTAALNFITGSLDDYGLPALADSFSFFHIDEDIHTANIEVVFPGHARPGHEVLIGAHWDSIDWPESYQIDPTTVAPGADDNGSGVVALLELARFLKGIRCENTIRLIFFAAEEISLRGSYRARERYRNMQEGDSLICMVNVDMIGYDVDEPDVSLIHNERTAELALETVETTRDLLRSTALEAVFETGGGSDHQPFWYYDLPAMWLHEGPRHIDPPYDICPYANTEADSLRHINPDYLTDCTRALAGITLHLAVPLDL